jgi:hypothetical protein
MRKDGARVVVIDRFEGEWAVLESEGDLFHVPRRMLPLEAKEGDVLNIRFNLDRKATDGKKEEIEKLARDLFID